MVSQVVAPGSRRIRGLRKDVVNPIPSLQRDPVSTLAPQVDRILHDAILTLAVSYEGGQQLGAIRFVEKRELHCFAIAVDILQIHDHGPRLLHPIRCRNPIINAGPHEEWNVEGIPARKIEVTELYGVDYPAGRIAVRRYSSGTAVMTASGFLRACICLVWTCSARMSFRLEHPEQERQFGMVCRSQ
jgi:hypothetical protein